MLDLHRRRPLKLFLPYPISSWTISTKLEDAAHAIRNPGYHDHSMHLSQGLQSVIDEIDRVLARHYGFTDEELDFIINYDIKYRMGDELEATDENE